jgi:hypothetical protein
VILRIFVATNAPEEYCIFSFSVKTIQGDKIDFKILIRAIRRNTSSMSENVRKCDYKAWINQKVKKSFYGRQKEKNWECNEGTKLIKSARLLRSHRSGRSKRRKWYNFSTASIGTEV